MVFVSQRRTSWGSGSPTLDDYLGPARRRFFGGGYRRVEQALTGLSVVIDDSRHGRISGRASVRYPSDWSRKGDRVVVPHLSSIDVLLMAGELTELYLTHSRRYDDAARRLLRLRSCRMRAGNAPMERDLEGFPVSATVTTAEDGRSSVVACQVGNLHARCEVEHPPGVVTTAPGSYADPAELLGSPRTRPFAGAHKTKTQVFEQLRIDVDDHRACALLSTGRSEQGYGPVLGLESQSHHATSLLDVFIAAIQLGQVLLYELDEVDRAASETLWMRRTTLEAGDPAVPVVEPAPLQVRLADPLLLTMAGGETWRTADIVAQCASFCVRCSVTHKLSTGGVRR